jgi:2-octaprenyl-6-methoxyphenol hydroxylase
MTQTYDLLIVGGGLVGASLAIALHGHGLRVGLVEARPLGDPGQPSYDDRALALSYGSRRILESIQLWPQLAEQVAPIRQIHISDQGHFGCARITAEQEQVPALGYVIPARQLGRVLWQQLHQCHDVTLLTPAQVTSVQHTPDQVQVTLQQGDQESSLTTRLLVAADGSNSRLREQLQIPATGWDYQQIAVVASITPGRPHADTAYQRFTPSGPVALLPQQAGHCTLIWTLHPEQHEQVLQYNDAQFCAAFQRQFGYRLGVLQRVGKRHSYPLRLCRAQQIVAQRTAIIGNAAHTLHPIAGQGLNLGLRDLSTLVDSVLAAQRAGRDIGAADCLGQYQSVCQREHQRMAQATDGLVRLFTSPLRSLQWARNIGLLAFDHLPPMKHALARAAMGL